jgi:hypothetical protein
MHAHKTLDKVVDTRVSMNFSNKLRIIHIGDSSHDCCNTSMAGGSTRMLCSLVINIICDLHVFIYMCVTLQRLSLQKG